ncbi:MAG: hypothetical protein C4K49_06405 [Candidatus Thorarchaeota archaeon]|nr:MAG: hypothetical protein C4K49_06405 [Candidatus Thorarchaeota archaeon]
MYKAILDVVGMVKAPSILPTAIAVLTLVAPFSAAEFQTPIWDSGTAWFFLFATLEVGSGESGVFLRTQPLWLEDTSLLVILVPLALIWVLFGLAFAILVRRTPDVSRSSEELIAIALALLLVEACIVVFLSIIRPSGSHSSWPSYGPLVPLPISLLMGLIELVILRNGNENSVMQ